MTAAPDLFTRPQIVRIVCYARPEPQGSIKAFMIDGKPRLTSDNKKMRPYRNELTREAMHTLAGMNLPLPAAGKHVPVRLRMDFYLARPKSIPARRTQLVVKPDVDKLVRATSDALKGTLYEDDAQVVGIMARKFYGTPERVEIEAQIIS